MRQQGLVLMAAAGLALSACAIQPATLGEVPPAVRRDTNVVAAPTRTALTQKAGLREKKVRTKRGPDVLVAVDDTECTVSPDEFRDTKDGDRVTCYWSAAAR